MTSFPDDYNDLLDAQVATLATVGGDGIPQQTAVWFLHEDGELKLSLNSSRLKARNLSKRPEAALMILDPENPYRYISVRGTVTLEPDDDYTFAKRVGAKYGGADLSENDNEGETRVIVTLEPKNVYAVDMSG